MALKLRFQGGPRAGEVLEFGDDVELIPIGRDPDRCLVTFPADETRVGREHCALKRVLGRYRLLLNKDNAVLIDGQRAIDDQELPETAELQCGVNGPVLVAVRSGSSPLPPTDEPAEKGRGKVTMLRETEARAKWGSTLAVLGVLLLAVASYVGFGWLGRTDERVGGVERDIQSIQGRVETLSTLTAEQRSVLQVVQTKVSALKGNTEELYPGLGDALRDAGRSVYLVMTRDARGDESALATAWAVDDGVLATNGHVAELIHDLSPGTVLLARSNDSEPRDFVVESVRIHPGYGKLMAMWMQYEPSTMSRKFAPVTPAGPACDVALLFVSARGLARPLPLAPDDVLGRLAPADPVGFVGYPMEGLSLGGVNIERPTPTVQIGHVTALTDYFGVDVRDASGAREGQLIQHSLPAAGGASGSPILNAQGQVVGLLNAGNVIGSIGTARIGSSAQINFGQRVDLLKELLDDSAEEHQGARAARWRDEMSQYYTPRTVAQLFEVVDQIPSLWANALDYRFRWTENEIARSRGTLSPSGSTSAEFRHESKLTVSGPTLVVAASPDVEELGLTLREGESGGSLRGTELLLSEAHLSAAQFMGQEGSEIEAVVNGPEAGAMVEVQVIQVEGVEVSPGQRRTELLEQWLSQAELGSYASVYEASDSLGPPPDDATGAVTQITLELRDAGEYLAVAIAPGGEDIDLLVAAGRDLLAQDREADNFPVGAFRADSGPLDVYVVGASAGIPFEFNLYFGIATGDASE